MKLFFFLFTAFASLVCSAQADFDSLYRKARALYKNREIAEFSKAICEAHKIHPYHQGALYYSGVAAALDSRPEEAVSYLKQSILIESRYDLKNPDLSSLNERDDFKKILRIQEEMNVQVINSDTAFIIKDRQLHVEGIAYNSVDKSFYVGSIHKKKVVKVDANGIATDFTKPDINGMTSIFGLKVDSKHKFLWVCTSPMEEMEGYDSTLKSKVIKYDITNGKILNSYEPPKEISNSVFGDLIIGKNNAVYVSDSRTNIIFLVNESLKRLDKYFESPEFINIQGIVFSDDHSQLFISDYVKGLYKLDVNTKQLTKIVCKADVSLKGVDGLLYYNNTLIAIQNGVFPLRSVQLTLSRDQSTITDFKTIDRSHPSFNEPTLGVINNDTLYYIANSQWSGYDENHKIKPADQLQDIVVLKHKLK